MFVGSLGVLVALLAVLASRLGVLFSLVVLPKIVMMRGLMMMMGSGMVMSSGLMMMVARRMLRRLCHGVFLPNRFLKMDAGCTLSIDIIVPTKL
jgi:hypothetical protein